MTFKPPQYIVLCNGAKRPRGLKGELHRLDYQKRPNLSPNLKIGLQDFVRHVNYLRDRLLDLLEIACYVYTADRKISRGSNRQLEFHSWSRSITFVIKVRDIKFWKSKEVRLALRNALVFLTGDYEYKFIFEAGHITQPADLFDRPEFQILKQERTRVALFSGGLDSTAGCLELLQTTGDNLCLVSHHSGNPSTKKTQRHIYESIDKLYKNRLRYYTFDTGLIGERATSESQRTRAFLFTTIAFAIAHAYDEKSFYVFDNGITSINLPRREDLMNSRASRTTHPQTIRYLEDLFSLVQETPVNINNPLLWRTKTDVVSTLKNTTFNDILTSTVSCGSTFKNAQSATHCGKCYQCIDRRLAIFASGLEDSDNPALYGEDIITKAIKPGETKTILIDYIAQALKLSNLSLNDFYSDYLNELSGLTEFVDGPDDATKIENIWELFRRHGGQINDALIRIRNKYDDPAKIVEKDSLMEIISQREYLKEPIDRLTERISNRLRKAIPNLFRTVPPVNEQDFNDKIEAILNDGNIDYAREYPTIRFAMAHTIPDHALENSVLLVESKYLRGKTTPSRITDEISADIIKYPDETYILFIIYDPERKISNDEEFTSTYEKKRNNCSFLIIR